MNFKNKNLISKSCFLHKIRFLQPRGHPHVVWLLQVGCTHPLLTHASQTLNIHIQHIILTQILISQTITVSQHEPSNMKQCKTIISIVSMIQNHHRRSQSPIINKKTYNLKFQNLFSVMRSFSWHMAASCLGIHWEKPYCSA